LLHRPVPQSDDQPIRCSIGLGVAHSLIAYKSTLRGLSKLDINPARLQADLDGAWEVLAEPIQTVMRKYEDCLYCQIITCRATSPFMKLLLV